MLRSLLKVVRDASLLPASEGGDGDDGDDDDDNSDDDNDDDSIGSLVSCKARDVSSDKKI